MLYPAALFEDQGHASLPACDALLGQIWRDALAVCGIEMHRRVLSLAHNADFERIEDTRLRASLEARNLMMGAELVLSADDIADTDALHAIARRFNKETLL